MRTDLLILIPAPLHGDTLPRRVLRPLAGRPLLSRTIDLAAEVVSRREQIVVLTDDDEVALFTERQGCRTLAVPEVRDQRGKQLAARLFAVVEHVEKERGESFSAVMLLQPTSPLVQPVDLERAVTALFDSEYDSLVSVCSDSHRVWRQVDGRYLPGFGVRSLDTVAPQSIYRETGTFLLSRRSAITASRLTGERIGLSVLPAERAIDVHTHHEWWICERLLQRKRVVFVVIGYAAVGLGHAYRASLLAHELIDHEVLVVCPRGSELAAKQLAAETFPVVVQGAEDLAETVLALNPELVVNDTLNTEREYVLRLKVAGVKVVNFEDLGPGADEADLVINDIFMETDAPPNRLNGPDYFAIRDEFLQAQPAPIRETVREVLVTFGGTDAMDSTHRIVRLILPLVRARLIHVTIVTGPGYAHLERLRAFLADVPKGAVELANGTKRMSEHMARADLAFSSAGRTVFELAAMRVPAIIVAANPREETHTFASAENGFIYLGRSDVVSDDAIVGAMVHLIDSSEERLALRGKMAKWDFRLGKKRVLAALLSLLDFETDSERGGDPDTVDNRPLHGGRRVHPVHYC